MYWGLFLNLFLRQTGHTDQLMPVLIVQHVLWMACTVSACFML